MSTQRQKKHDVNRDESVLSFSDRFVKEVLHMQQSIYWARFWNITCKQDKFGIWKGVFLDSSRVRLLSHEDGSVVDRLK